MRGTALLPSDLTEAELASAPVLASVDSLLVDGLSNAEDDAFAARCQVDPAGLPILTLRLSAFHGIAHMTFAFDTFAPLSIGVPLDATGEQMWAACCRKRIVHTLFDTVREWAAARAADAQGESAPADPAPAEQPEPEAV